MHVVEGHTRRDQTWVHRVARTACRCGQFGRQRVPQHTDAHGQGHRAGLHALMLAVLTTAQLASLHPCTSCWGPAHPPPPARDGAVDVAHHQLGAPAVEVDVGHQFSRAAPEPAGAPKQTDVALMYRPSATPAKQGNINTVACLAYSLAQRDTLACLRTTNPLERVRRPNTCVLQPPPEVRMAWSSPRRPEVFSAQQTARTPSPNPQQPSRQPPTPRRPLPQPPPHPQAPTHLIVFCPSRSFSCASCAGVGSKDMRVDGAGRGSGVVCNGTSGPRRPWGLNHFSLMNYFSLMCARGLRRRCLESLCWGAAT